MIRNAIPVTGISYDLFNWTYEAHLAGVKFFHEKLKPQLEWFFEQEEESAAALS